MESSYCEEFLSVVRFLWPNHVSLIEIHRQFLGFTSDGVMRVQRINSCREFESGRTDIRDNRTSRPRISRMELIL